MQTRSLLVVYCALLFEGCAASPQSEEPGYVDQAQTSTYSYALALKLNGQCVDVPAASMDNGVQLQRYPCNGTNAQVFTATDRGNGYWELRRQYTNKCIDRDVSGRVQQWDCGGIASAAQGWQLNNVGDGNYEVKNQASGQCLDAWNNLLVGNTCNGTDAQRFRLTSVSNGNAGDCPTYDGYALMKAYDFNGSGAPSDSDWSVLNYPAWTVNDERQCYSNALENVTQSDGVLKLRALYKPGGVSCGNDGRNPRKYTSGRITSQTWYNPGMYGTNAIRIVARARTTARFNYDWPAFWLVGDNWPNHGELDILETVNTNGWNQMSGHAGDHSGVNSWNSRTSYVDWNQFHTWQLDWSRDPAGWANDAVEFSLDGVSQWTKSRWECGSTSEACWPYTTYGQQIVANVAIGGSWPTAEMGQGSNWWAADQDPSTQSFTSGAGNGMDLDWICIYKRN